jgi:hypothetical protein|tara:strand:+ start:584 stop:967 length:384 start_codon:yes stop_codon:yes gene_type:complete
MDLSILSDLHKEARNFRPSSEYCTWFATLPLERQQKEWANLQQQAKDRQEQEDAERAECYTSWCDHINYLMESNNIDRKTAIRWSIDGEQIVIHTFQDVEHYCFINNLPHEKWAEVVRLFFPDWKGA